jgi:hypothetical protein
MATQNQTIEIGSQTPIAAASALKKVGYNVTSGGKPVNVSETADENQTMLDVFPELNQQVPEEGGEPKDVNPKQPELKKIKLPNDKLPRETKESVTPKQKNVMEKFKGKIMNKREVLEVIRGAQPATTPSPGTSPTTTPTIAPSKPAQRPERKNPFKPKHKPNPKGQIPDWMTSDKLGIGDTENLQEVVKKIAKNNAIKEQDIMEGNTLMDKIKILRTAIIRLLHVQDIFAKSDVPEVEIGNILRIIKAYKNRI